MTRPKVTLVRGLRAPGAGSSRPADELAALLTDDMAGQHFATSASCEGSLALILDAVMRGASLTVTIEQPLLGEVAFLDELRRVADVNEPSAMTFDPITVALLEFLADGESTAGAAKRLHLSTRSAYRMLNSARTALGVSTNMEALLIARSGTGTVSNP